MIDDDVTAFLQEMEHRRSRMEILECPYDFCNGRTVTEVMVGDKYDLQGCEFTDVS
jgi:hypothetical protein